MDGLWWKTLLKWMIWGIWSFPFYNLHLRHFWRRSPTPKRPQRTTPQRPASTRSRQAMNFFTKPAMSYGEFKQQCISLRWSWWEIWEIGMMRMECLEWWNAWCFETFFWVVENFFGSIWKKKVMKETSEVFFWYGSGWCFFKRDVHLNWFGPDGWRELVVPKDQRPLCNISLDCLDLAPRTQ